MHPPDSKTNAKRAALTAKIADVMLSDGDAGPPLRDLAARLGTSDRMLLYYFGDKAGLIRAAVAELAQRLEAVLADHRIAGRRAPAQVLRTTAAFMSLAGVAPFRAVWADILARGGRGEAPFDVLAKALVQGAIDSLDQQLAIRNPNSRRRMAGAILACIEGVWLVSMVAPGSTDGAIDILVDGLA
jgi:AcrR family transcriptional regulator